MRFFVLALALFFCSAITHGQTYTFKCVTNASTMDADADSCEGCAVWLIQSRSFDGLLIYKDAVPYRWIEIPYTVKVRTDTVDIWEHTSPPSYMGRNKFFPDRVSILLSETNFATMQDFVDSTFCNALRAYAQDSTPIFYASDSLNHAPIFRGDTVTIVGRDLAHVTFDSLFQKYVIQVDSVSGGGGATNLSYSVGGSPVTLFSSTGTDVGIIAGTGIGLSSTATDLTITNSAPDQTVSLTQGGTTVITGTYPNFTITSNDAFVGTVTSVSSGNLSPLFNVTVGTPTTTPAFSFAQINQAANLIFAGPATGAAAAPTFRAMVAADLPVGTNLWTDAGIFTYLTATTDRAVVGSATELNTSYIMQAKGGLFVQGAGSTSGTFAGIFEKADGTDILNVRNDGFVGINNSAPAYRLDVVGDVSIDAASAYRISSKKMMYNPFGNNFFFAQAGNITSTADRAIGIGENALLKITTGSLDIAIGPDALKECTTCSQNFAIGTGTLQRCTTGVANVGVGLYVLNFNTASNNTGIGDQVMTVNTSGTKNVGIGTLAVYNNTTASDNTGVGVYALLNNTTGGDNTAMGRSSLEGLNGGIRNIAIGNYAADNLTTGSRNICIGWNIDMPTATTTEELNIGNLIFGNGINASGTTISGGYVGIGVNAPTQRLHVNGNARVTGAYYDSNNDPGTASQVLSSTATGTDWIAAPSAPTILTLNNGLTLTGTNGQWGGPLVQNTTIDQSSFYYLHKDGKRSFMRYEGNPFTDVNVTSSVDITGKGLSPSTSAAPSEDNILAIRGHDGGSTYYANALFFGVYTTATNGVWLQSRSESAYTTEYPVCVNPNGGQFAVGRNPVANALDAFATISTSGLSGSGVAGSVLHLDNIEGNGKASMTFGVGADVLDGEIGYFDGADVVRVTNRNTASSSQIRLAIGGETTDRVVLMPTSAASNARLGVGFNSTTDLTSTILSKGSLGAAALSTSGAPTFDETKFFVVYTAAGAQTYTLPAQSDCKGRIFWIQNNSSAGTITLSVAVKKANGATFNTLAPGEFCQFISDGADFWGYKQTSL